MSLGVHSEVGRLQKVLVHQPGWEHRRMIPWNREAMLCDDILDIDMARLEHKGFVQRMQQAGVEVLYFLDLLKDVCADPKQHAEVVQAVTPGGLPPHVAPTDIQPTHLVIGYPEHYRFGEKVLLEPAVNLYFMRDPAFFLTDKLVISSPKMPIRKREAYLMREVARRHPVFEGVTIYDGILEDPDATIEGGDVLIPDDKTTMVGISERTNERGAEMLAEYLFENTTIERVLKVHIPKRHEYMHLDTILTFVDRQQIVTLPYIWEDRHLYQRVVAEVREQVARLGATYAGPSEDVYEDCPRLDVLFKDGRREHYANAIQGMEDLDLIVREITVPVGGNAEHYDSIEEHILEALREQWNDGANTFALKPGHVITYSRNARTIRGLEDVMVEVTTFPGGELVRGRGGARCMTMPLKRSGV